MSHDPNAQSAIHALAEWCAANTALALGATADDAADIARRYIARIGDSPAPPVRTMLHDIEAMMETER